MTFNFDEIIDRRGTSSFKWDWYGDEVLPLWVADMDFTAPPPVIAALRQRVEHGVFGYEFDPKPLKATIQERLLRLYGWEVQPSEIVFLPGIVAAFNAVCRAVGAVGDSVIMQTPVYPPFLSAPGNYGKTAITADLAVSTSGRLLRYDIDFDVFENAIQPNTRLFMLCNPHNPVGRVFTCPELERLAAICERHNLIICSDEIHCDLLLDGHRHTPIASLAPEVAARTITLMAPSKTFNIPGLGCGFAIIPNPELRQQVQAAADGIAGHVNVMGFTGTQAAYQLGQPWLDDLLPYLTANRNFVTDYVQTHFPGVTLTQPEGTYLSWLDWRGVALPENAYNFFLKNARVALNDGAAFGPAGAGFTRLNFGTPRATLLAALERMRVALAAVTANPAH